MGAHKDKTKTNIPAKLLETCKQKNTRIRMKYDLQKIVNAMEAIESGTVNVTKASKLFGIPRQTLSDRVKGKYSKVGGGRKTELTENEEKILVDYCMFMVKCSHPLTVSIIKGFAWGIVKKSNRPSRFSPTDGPSWKWWRGFKRRHPEISLWKPDHGRSRINNQVVMDKFFKLLKEELESIDILNKPEHIFNADETGIDLNAISGKVIVCKSSKHAYSEQKAPRDHFSSMVCCSGSGQILRPVIIFEKNRPSGPYSRNGPDGCLYGKSPNGYMDEELFLTWFEEIFVPGTSHARPTLLIIDGHWLHISYSIMKRAVEENIKIILLPPHIINVLQPLDIGLFRSSKSNFSNATDGVKMLSVTGDYQNVNKTNFTGIFKESFERSMILTTIKNGFRKTGICPLNPEAIDKTKLIPIDNSSSDNEEFSDKCGVCKSKYPPFSEPKKCSGKMVDKWIQCDMCTEWFHLICLPQSVDPEDDFVCENCC